MISASLTMALDFARQKDVPHTTTVYRRGGVWYAVKSGPTYSNHFRITAYDEEGRKQLEAKEDRSVSDDVPTPDTLNIDPPTP